MSSTCKPISDLNPVFHVGGEPHVMLTQALASVPSTELKHAALSLDPITTRSCTLHLLLVGSEHRLNPSHGSCSLQFQTRVKDGRP